MADLASSLLGAAAELADQAAHDAAPPILRALRPREIWDGIPVPSHEPLTRLRAAARRARVPWIERREGESLALGRLRIRVLNPPAADWERNINEGLRKVGRALVERALRSTRDTGGG